MANGKPGRPTKYTPQIADEVAEWISAGKTLRDYCRQPGKPARRTIDRWREHDEEFSSRIARARDEGFDVLAERLLELARKPLSEGEQGVQHKDLIQMRKLEIETTLKLLAKWDPRRYGDLRKVEHSGSMTFAQLVEQSYEEAEAE